MGAGGGLLSLTLEGRTLRHIRSVTCCQKLPSFHFFLWPLTRHEACLPSARRSERRHCVTVNLALRKSPARLQLLGSPQVKAGSGFYLPTSVKRN